MMETSGGSSDAGGSSRSYRLQFSPSGFIQARLSAALEHLGVLRLRTSHAESESLVGDGPRGHPPGAEEGEVSIRIVGAGDQESLRARSSQPQPLVVRPGREGNPSSDNISSELLESSSERQGGDGESNNVVLEADSPPSSVPASASPAGTAAGTSSTAGESNATGDRNRGPYQRYDIQHVARWIEQILPFSLLLLVVFIRQHLQGTHKCIRILLILISLRFV